MNKKVLVNYTGRTGGGALYSYEMTKGLINNGVDVYAIISEDNELIIKWKELRIKDLLIIPTYTNKKEFILNSLKLIFTKSKELERFYNIEFDLEYVPMITFWTFLLDSSLKRKKIALTLHDPILHSGEKIVNRLFYAFSKKYIKKSDYIIILSNIFKDKVSEIYNKNCKSVIVIPHGIFCFYKGLQKNRIQNLYHDKNKINFVFFGRIEKYKGIDTLLSAYKKLEKVYPDRISLTIAGNGDFGDYSVEFNELKNATLINRWIKDEEVSSLFSGDNIVTVLPYKDATQSGVVSISMINKSLIIASNTGGLKEQLQDGRFGLLFNPNSEDELFLIMEQIVLNTVVAYKRIYDSAYEYAKGLSWENLSKILLESTMK